MGKNPQGGKMTYIVKLTPDLRNLATEGSLDTAVVAGNSIQRTVYLDVYNGTDRKIVEAKDGDSFDDTMQTLADLENSGHKFILVD
jgi:hypothetical protein